MEIINGLLQGVSKLSEHTEQIRKDIILLEFTIVNCCIIIDSRKSTSEWILVDTGLNNSASFIKKSTEEIIGEEKPPIGILLTHGHFDHVGSVMELAEYWDVPVYAHEAEIPYLTGKKDYPKGDSTVDGGLVAEMSPAFPHHSINLGYRVVPLPSDGTIPGLNDWKWIHTPGHTPGHVSFYRERDGILIAGDAFTSLKQESLASVMTQREEISGPPKYLTTDWESAKKSIRKLYELKPSLAILSHGKPMEGDDLNQHLALLVNHFDEIAVPNQGRFVNKEGV